MDIEICDGESLTLEDGTLGTFADKNGNIVAVLVVSANCWSRGGAKGVSVALVPGEQYSESETTVTRVPADCDPNQTLMSQGVKVCRNQSGQIVKCPPR